MNEEDLNEQLNRDFNEEMDKEESEQMNNRSGNLNNNINNKPVASSKYTLEEINASLLEELEEKENEIEQLKLQLSSGGGMMSNESEKIVQLAKKVCEVTGELCFLLTTESEPKSNNGTKQRESSDDKVGARVGIYNRQTQGGHCRQQQSNWNWSKESELGKQYRPAIETNEAKIRQITSEECRTSTTTNSD